MLPPRPLFAAALLVMAGLAALVESGDDPVVLPADALRWEGQRVVMQGFVTSLRLQTDGPTRFQLVADGHAVDAYSQDRLFISVGSWIHVPGRLARLQGQLVLLVTPEADIRETAGPDASRPTWDDVALRPDHWATRTLQLAGTVDRGELRDGSGHRVMLGDGPWPKAGAVNATGLLRYDDGCICHRFDAREVLLWTS